MYPYLPRETRNYVPMFIATALIASNPDAFNIKPNAPGPRYAYHYVPIQGSLSLQAVADLTGSDVDAIRALNPELRRAYLPPSEGPYYLRIPLGTYDQFVEGYKTLPEEAKQPPGEYIVRRGDTLGKIARQYGLTVNQNMRQNDLRSTKLRIGQRLIVPVPRYEGAIALPTLAEADQMTVDYGRRAVRPLRGSGEVESLPVAQTVPVVKASTPARTTSASSSSNSGNTRIVYRVRRGDTLGKIARKYGVSVRNLQSWNNLRGTGITAGQRLSIYGSGSASSASTSTSSSGSERIVYRVRKGDTLGHIAEKYGVTASQLRRWNNIRGSKIRIGQRLTVYPRTTASSTQTQSHRVRRGDTLSSIARRYGVSVQNLKSWNGLSSNTIKPGQTLTVRR